MLALFGRISCEIDLATSADDKRVAQVESQLEFLIASAGADDEETTDAAAVDVNFLRAKLLTVKGLENEQTIVACLVKVVEALLKDVRHRGVLVWLTRAEGEGDDDDQGCKGVQPGHAAGRCPSSAWLLRCRSHPGGPGTVAAVGCGAQGSL